jgi:hypothetical protein
MTQYELTAAPQAAGEPGSSAVEQVKDQAHEAAQRAQDVAGEAQVKVS